MIETADQARVIDASTVFYTAVQAPVTRVEIAWYMVASYDLNPIHIDEPFAQEAGFNSVIGQGMLPLGYLARELLKIVGLHRIRKLSGDFVGLVYPGEVLTIEIKLEDKHERVGGVELVWVLTANGQDAVPRIHGAATTFHQ